MVDIATGPKGQTEVALAEVRQLALQEYLHGNHSPVQLNGTATETAMGLRLDTQATAGFPAGFHDMMIVSGSEGQPNYQPFLSRAVSGDFTVARAGADTQLVHFNRSTSLTDFMSPDKFTMQMSVTGLKGNAIGSYDPALAVLQSKNGVAQTDANNQYVYLSSPAGNSANCFNENESNPNNHRVQCDYLISGLGPNPLSYNETRENDPAGYYRHSVLRDRTTVLGIVDEHFTTNKAGVITSYEVSVRPPRAPGAATK